MSAGQAPGAPTLRRAMEDSWADALINRRWQRLATRLSAADCEQLLQRASQRALVVGGSRWVSSDNATEGWALPDSVPVSRPAAGPVSPAGPAHPASPARQTAPASAPAKPGRPRNLGSQKLAN